MMTRTIHLNYTNTTGTHDDDSKKHTKQQRLEDVVPARANLQLRYCCLCVRVSKNVLKGVTCEFEINEFILIGTNHNLS